MRTTIYEKEIKDLNEALTHCFASCSSDKVEKLPIRTRLSILSLGHKIHDVSLQVNDKVDQMLNHIHAYYKGIGDSVAHIDAGFKFTLREQTILAEYSGIGNYKEKQLLMESKIVNTKITSCRTVYAVGKILLRSDLIKSCFNSMRYKEMEFYREFYRCHDCNIGCNDFI